MKKQLTCWLVCLIFVSSNPGYVFSENFQSNENVPASSRLAPSKTVTQTLQGSLQGHLRNADKIKAAVDDSVKFLMGASVLNSVPRAPQPPAPPPQQDEGDTDGDDGDDAEVGPEHVFSWEIPNHLESVGLDLFKAALADDRAELLSRIDDAIDKLDNLLNFINSQLPGLEDDLKAMNLKYTRAQDLSMGQAMVWSEMQMTSVESTEMLNGVDAYQQGEWQQHQISGQVYRMREEMERFEVRLGFIKLPGMMAGMGFQSDRDRLRDARAQIAALDPLAAGDVYDVQQILDVLIPQADWTHFYTAQFQETEGRIHAYFDPTDALSFAAVKNRFENNYQAALNRIDAFIARCDEVINNVAPYDPWHHDYRDRENVKRALDGLKQHRNLPL